jgi:hypothetical protein
MTTPVPVSRLLVAALERLDGWLMASRRGHA